MWRELQRTKKNTSKDRKHKIIYGVKKSNNKETEREYLYPDRTCRKFVHEKLFFSFVYKEEAYYTPSMIKINTAKITKSEYSKRNYNKYTFIFCQYSSSVIVWQPLIINIKRLWQIKCKNTLEEYQKPWLYIKNTYKVKDEEYSVTVSVSSYSHPHSW